MVNGGGKADKRGEGEGLYVSHCRNLRGAADWIEWDRRVVGARVLEQRREG